LTAVSVASKAKRNTGKMKNIGKMRAHRGLILAQVAVIFSVFLFPGRSFGWGNTWLGVNLEQIVNAARLKIGPFRGNVGFQLGNVGYDSDIYFGNTRDRTPDYTFAARPSAHFYLPLKKGIVLDIAEAPQYVFYLKTKAERAWNNSFLAQAHFALDGTAQHPEVQRQEDRQRDARQAMHHENPVGAFLLQAKTPRAARIPIQAIRRAKRESTTSRERPRHPSHSAKTLRRPIGAWMVTARTNTE